MSSIFWTRENIDEINTDISEVEDVSPLYINYYFLGGGVFRTFNFYFYFAVFTAVLDMFHHSMDEFRKLSFRQLKKKSSSFDKSEQAEKKWESN